MVRRKEYLQEMGIDLWQSKDLINKSKNMDKKGRAQTISDTLATIKEEVQVCTLCALHQTRTHTVFGVGNQNAEAMFIGEAPGANEDRQGEPFVGRAGMLLNAMLQAIGCKRTEVYIANILKCRPPNNRDPLASEVKLCTPYLQRQISLIQPKILIAVGRIAAQFLLNSMEPMSKLRGRFYQYGKQQTPLLVTYHPAYLLRSPSEKSKAYADFLMIKKALSSNP